MAHEDCLPTGKCSVWQIRNPGLNSTTFDLSTQNTEEDGRKQFKMGAAWILGQKTDRQTDEYKK